jgi:biotin operon repressor
LGNDNKPGNSDWSDPQDPTSKPNIPPVITFYGEDMVTDPKNPTGPKVQRIEREAKQKITFNKTLIKVTDENLAGGLTYKWDWDEGDDLFIRTNVRPNDPPTVHTYEVPSTYEIVLVVVDDIGNEGTAKLIVDVTYPEGVTEQKIEIERDRESFAEKNTIQRGGWVAYFIEDVEQGDTITFEYEVEQDLSTNYKLGVRLFVIPKKDFDTYENNDITKKYISRKYKEYWSGNVNTVSPKMRIEIEAKEDDDIVIIVDNKYYEEGQSYIPYNEPVKTNVNIKRQQPSFFEKNATIIIALIVVLLIIVFLLTFLYTKVRRDRVLDNKNRGKIFSYINDNPGVHYRGVMNGLNLQTGVLTHHLSVLENQQFIKSSNDGMYKRYYPLGANIDPNSKLTEPQARILRKIQASPGISQTEIANELDQNRKSVHYHVKRLSDEGLIQVEPDGRVSKCFSMDRQQIS